ncbi:Small RNA 2'-O-methyltransferase [Dinochytrium kinnereticum]|nr:Small RNA 2'-O-methyltransferase [Dinochytrium kinnereticum]
MNEISSASKLITGFRLWTWGVLAGVDKNPERVELAIRSCAPSDYDRTYLRELPVHLELFVGSLASYDPRLEEYEGIACVEVIEHLDPDTLRSFPAVVFGLYRPKVAVISTPNAEFNVHFPNLKYGTPQSTFRDDDHKFEWTRQQFQQWANQVAENFGYFVTFSGVGIFPKSKLETGPCTQIATFIRKEHPPKLLTTAEDILPEGRLQHELKATIDFPYFEEDRFSDKDILNEIMEILSSRLYFELARSDDVNSDDWKLMNETISSRWPRPGTYEFDVDSIWGNLRLRQLCKSLDRLMKAMTSDDGSRLFAVISRDNAQACFATVICEIPFPEFKEPVDQSESEESERSESDDALSNH